MRRLILLVVTLAAASMAKVPEQIEVVNKTECGYVREEYEGACLDSLRTGKTFVIQKDTTDPTGKRRIILPGNPIHVEATGLHKPASERESLEGIDFSLKVLASLSAFWSAVSLYLLLR